VLPEDCPILCVWLMGKSSAPRTTDNDDSIMSIGVSWQVEAVGRAETLMEDQERSRATLGAILAIQRRIRLLFQKGWAEVAPENIDEAYDGFLAEVDYTPPSALDTGLVEGYALTVRVMCLEPRT
jgi:hypothetical protein